MWGPGAGRGGAGWAVDKRAPWACPSPVLPGSTCCPSRPAAAPAGHYAHSLQLYPAASSHFRAALASDATLLHDPAALAAALAELHSDAGPAGMRAAAELLEDRQLTDQEHVLSLPVHDRAEALICNALRAQRGGDADKARLQLTKALKAAHAHLGNTQLVAQILNVLAPIQALKGDHAGAEQMLSSSTTLAKVHCCSCRCVLCSALKEKRRADPRRSVQKARRLELAPRTRSSPRCAAGPRRPAHAAGLEPRAAAPVRGRAGQGGAGHQAAGLHGTQGGRPAGGNRRGDRAAVPRRPADLAAGCCVSTRARRPPSRSGLVCRACKG